MENQSTAPSSNPSSRGEVAPLSKLAPTVTTTEKDAESDQALASTTPQPWWRRKRNILIAALVLLVILVIAIPVGVVYGNKKSSNIGDSASSSSSPSSNPSAPTPTTASNPKQTETKMCAGIPCWAVGTYYDVKDWYTTEDFNTTFTDETVGGLPIIGLYTNYDDSAKANPNVPALNEKWDYGTLPFRGVNIGGWFLVEPFISPQYFDIYNIDDGEAQKREKELRIYTEHLNPGIVDEWTLSKKLGPAGANHTLEKHYATFANEQTFAEIQEAGFDHVRFPFGYWAVKTYGDDPYVPMISFRYILRAIEWARKYGLRIFLDLHGVPGSQNGFEHSGRVGPIDWLAGPDGALNGQRTLEIHKQLSTFFAQERYQNIVTLYGLVNEPNMTYIGADTVIAWNEKAIDIIREADYKNLIIMSDGFESLAWWDGQMQGIEGLVLDAHNYIVYDTTLISMTHSQKVQYACQTWGPQAETSSTSGFGPTMFGEWSFADTECVLYQNGVGLGSRWNGTFQPSPGEWCPLENEQCDCSPAILEPTAYSQEYQLFQATFAMAQMDAFANGYGWFHWTWYGPPQWSWKTARDAGYLPDKIYQPSWTCNDNIPSFANAGLPEYY